MRPIDDPTPGRHKPLSPGNERARLDLVGKRFLLDEGGSMGRAKAPGSQYRMSADANDIAESIKAYKPVKTKLPLKIPAIELEAVDALRERAGTSSICHRIDGYHVVELRAAGPIPASLLSKAVTDLPALREVCLTGGNLEGIPRAVMDLSNLQVLDLSGNKLSDLTGIGRLERLHDLRVGSNRLTTIQDDIARLVELERLVAPCNSLSPLSDNVGDLLRLKHLDVSENKLTALPDAIGNLASLKELRAGGNYLSRLPSSLGKLVGLEALDLENNFINVLPDCIERLRCGSLKQLNLTGNPMRGSGENRDPWDCE